MTPTSAGIEPASRLRRGVALLHDNAPLITSRLAGLSGVLAVLDVIWSGHWRVISALSPWVPEPASRAATVAVAVSGLLLIRVSVSLRKGKRSALVIAVLAATTIWLVDLLRREWRPVESVLVGLLLLAMALSYRRFEVRNDPHGPGFAFRIGAQFAGSAVVAGMVLLYVPGQVADDASPADRFGEVLRSMVGVGGSITFERSVYAGAVHAVLLGLGLLAFGSVVVLLLRPFEPVAALDGEDVADLRALLAAHGAADSLGYFALRDDKAVVWSPSRKAAVSYRVESGVALASGDPLGDREAWPGAISAFCDLAGRHGWTPAVIGCSEAGATVWTRQAGMAALALGDEAILDPAVFTLEGRAMRDVRQACSRVARAGYTVELRRVADLDEAEIEELRRRAEQWRGDEVERGFSMALSRLGARADGDCVVLTAHADGELRGLLHFVPWGVDGLSLDLMRRDRSADNGLNEYMIASAMPRFAEAGIVRVSLNFAVFRDALDRGAQIGAGPVLRAWRQTLLFASRWWQIDSLFRFNDKFRPTWQPRFVCYPAARDLPRIALAIMEAESFITRPRLRRPDARV